VFLVTRRYQFAASHRLHARALDDEANRRLYGKCNHPFGHGHNYIVEVTARGPVDAATGAALDPRRLDELVEREVLRPFDHRDLNRDVDAFRDVTPTSENLAVEICRRLKRGWPTVFPGDWPRLEKVRIAETARNIFEMNAHEIQ
jgi:6-pyruvoyltetrahydropterin/6-carboxytetrahydropterin synthase